MNRELLISDAEYLPPRKSWQYSVSRGRISPTMKGDRDWKSMAQIRAEYPTRNLSGNRLPIAREREIMQFMGRLTLRHPTYRLPTSPPTAKDKLIRLVKKVRKKTGRTYFQRAQTARFMPIVKQVLVAKKYIKGVHFGYAIGRRSNLLLNSP